jgi:hypothetical protein
MTKLTVAFFIFANAPKTQQLLIQDTNSSQKQQFYYIITFKATCFDCIESSSCLLKKRSNVATFIVHSGITKAYNRWYSQYTTGIRGAHNPVRSYARSRQLSKHDNIKMSLKELWFGDKDLLHFVKIDPVVALNFRKTNFLSN